MNTFHHAYNGIPTLRDNKSFFKESFFKDGAPTPLDHLAPGTYSGTLKLTIETKTPLITAWRDTNGRLVVPSASGNPNGATADKDAMIPATSLKGVLSSAFEEITQSRMRVFGDHTLQPQFRYTTDHTRIPIAKSQSGWTAAFLKPSNEGNKIIWHIQPYEYALLPDSILAGVAFTPTGEENRSIYGGFRGVPKVDRNGNPKRKNGRIQYKRGPGKRIHHTNEEEKAIRELLTRVRQVTPHLSEVNSLRVFDRKFWGITIPVVSEINGIKLCISKGSKKKRPQPYKVNTEAWVVRLTKFNQNNSLKDNERLVQGKYNEFIFYLPEYPKRKSQITLDHNSALIATVMIAARNQIAEENETRGEHTLISRTIDHIRCEFGGKKLKEKLTLEHVYKALLKEGQEGPGIPVFARRHAGGKWEITFSQLGRSVSPDSLPPENLARRGAITPACSLVEASSADRLWGFVTQDSNDEAPPALKGRIFLENAYLSAGSLQQAQHEGWIPPILASPKPWTAQPYLRSITGQGVFDVERSKCFTEQHSLIRKTYPTHRFLTSKKASPTLTPKTKGQALAGSEVLIGSYIEPGATLESILRFEGLTAEEISTILWLLTPENLVPKTEQKPGEEGYFHLGLGKPLGLGTVSIFAEILSLHDSQSLADGYKDLDLLLCHNLRKDNNEEEQATNKIPDAVSNALNAIKEHPSPAVLAFMRSSYGWKEDEDEQLERDPVSYTPYPSSDKKSSIIDYFKDYEQKRIKGEDQDDRFKMITLEEEDIESSSASCPTATVSSTQVQQTARSNAT